MSILLPSEQCHGADNKEPFPKIFLLWTYPVIEKFFLREYPWFIDTYKSYPYPVQQANAARYFILYHYGGVYLDIDSECLVSFDHIIKRETSGKNTKGVLLAYSELVGFVNQVLFAKARHPFWKHIIDHLVESKGWYILPVYNVIASTGPIYLLRAWWAYPCKEQIYIMTSYYIHQKHYLNHKGAHTWQSWDGLYFIPFLRYLIRHFIPLLTFSILVVLLKKRCFRLYQG